VSFEPVVVVTAETDATFETSVGVIHRVGERDRFVVRADRSRPSVLDGDAGTLVAENHRRTIDLDEETFREVFDTLDVKRFGQTETEYKEWAVDRLREHHTTTVEYTGDNNVTYTKTCEPKQSDVTVESVTAVYLPEIRQATDLGEYSYPYEYYAAGPSRVTVEDGIHRCVHCDADASTYTYCDNCGSVNCGSHTKTERLEGTPICTGCAVTERFALKTKYFYDEANRDAFAEEYAEMGVHEKAMENVPLTVGGGVVLLVLLVVAAVSLGIV
jgi:restriction endonuclease Mrr